MSVSDKRVRWKVNPLVGRLFGCGQQDWRYPSVAVVVSTAAYRWIPSGDETDAQVHQRSGNAWSILWERLAFCNHL